MVLAVLMTCYNRVDTTLECLRRLFACKLPQDAVFDVWLNDDGCTDGTGERTREFFETRKVQGWGGDGHIVKGSGHDYWCGGMRRVWDAASRHFNYDGYLWLNDDTWLMDDAIESLLSAPSPDAVVVGAVWSRAHDKMTYGGQIAGKLVAPNGSYQSVESGHGNVVWVPRMAFDVLGNFDKHWTHAIGDADYTITAVEKGISLLTTDRFVASCDYTIRPVPWSDSTVPLRKRIKSLYSPMGYCEPRLMFRYWRKHDGLLLACMRFVKLHIKVLFPLPYIAIGKSAKSRIFVADINSLDTCGTSQGHYLKVFRNYREVLSDKFDVIVTGGKIFAQYFSDNFLCLPRCAQRQSWRMVNKFRNIVNIRFLLKAAQGETIVFQSSALTMVYLGVLIWARHGTRIFVIQYSSKHGGANSLAARFLYWLAKHKITGNICPSDDVGKTLGIQYCVVPDYILSQAKSIIVGKHIAYDFAIVGILNRSKGILEAVRFFAGKKCRVIVAGRCDDKCLVDEIDSVVGGCTNIKFLQGYLPEKTLDDILLCSSYVVLNYSDDYSEHSSGIVYDALAHGCPILGRRCKGLRFAEDGELGCFYNGLEEVDIERLLDAKRVCRFVHNISAYINGQALIAEKLNNYLSRK